VLVIVLLFLAGCAVDEIRVVSYTSSAEVEAPQSSPASLAARSSVPWDMVLSGVSDILTGARKKAIEEKVGYEESRSFTLLRVKAARSAREQGDEQPSEQENQASPCHQSP
jgi:hypothetical protein